MVADSSLSSDSSASAAPPAKRRIQVRIASSRYATNRYDGQRIRIEVLAAELMPTNIFAYLTLPLNPQTLSRVAQFDHICSSADLEDYPEDAPLPLVRPEFFRLSYVDVIVRSVEEAAAFKRDVLEDIRTLKRTLDVMDTLNGRETLWIDDPPPPDDSSWSSASIEGS